jgi:hypothetical protein
MFLLIFCLESIILNSMNDFNMADTGGLRNEEPLTVEQKEQVLEYAISLGMPADQIVFIDYGLTAYSGEYDVLKVGTDVLPLSERIRNPNCNISLKGTIAHELVGHREAHINGLTQTDDLLEEVQASIRAARFAPDLSKLERMDLLRDGICRLNKRGISLHSVKHKLHIDRR